MKLNEFSPFSKLGFVDFLKSHYLHLYRGREGVCRTTWAGHVNYDWNNALNWTNGLPVENMICLIPLIPEECYYPRIKADLSINFSLFNEGFLYNEGIVKILQNGVFQNYGTFENANVGIIENFSSISNEGTFTNAGSIDNLNIFVNAGTFYNDGHFNNEQIFGNVKSLVNTGFFDNQCIVNNAGDFAGLGQMEEHKDSIFNDLKISR